VIIEFLIDRAQIGNGKREQQNWRWNNLMVRVLRMKVQKEEIRTGSSPGRRGKRRHGVEIFRQSGGELDVDRIWGRFTWIGIIIII
jgi:hypothetical protein